MSAYRDDLYVTSQELAGLVEYGVPGSLEMLARTVSELFALDMPPPAWVMRVLDSKHRTKWKRIHDLETDALRYIQAIQAFANVPSPSEPQPPGKINKGSFRAAASRWHSLLHERPRADLNEFERRMVAKDFESAFDHIKKLKRRRP